MAFRDRWSSAKTLPRTHWPVIAVEMPVAGCAFYGGAALVRQDAIGVELWPIGAQFANGVSTGVLLLLFVAAPMAVAVALELVRSPAAVLASIVAGGALVAWSGVQILITQRFFAVEPVMLTVGLAVMVLAVAVRRHEPSPRRRAQRRHSAARPSRRRPARCVVRRTRALRSPAGR